MEKHVKIYYDKEGDFLEVRFSDEPGYMVETENEAVMQRVDDEGNILGFSIISINKLTEDKPISVELKPLVIQ